jgi:hypothetical protein
MGRQGRARVLGLFDPASMGRIIQARYEQLLGLPADRPGSDGDKADADAVQAVIDVPPDGVPPAGVRPSRSDGPVPEPGVMAQADASDARTLNWRFVVPAEPDGMLLLPSDGERIQGAVVTERTPEALVGALARGRYPAVAIPDLTGWVGLDPEVESARELLQRLGASVAPGGWLYAGFANAYSPLRPFGRGTLSRASAVRALRAAGFDDPSVYVPFPDQRLPAYLVSAMRQNELGYFLRELSFPHVEDATGIRGMLRRRSRSLLQRAATALPPTLTARLVPSFAIVARRRT